MMDLVTPPNEEPARTELRTPKDLLDRIGKRLGTSPWVTISQADVDDFARITRDEQWIHVDRERAAAGPFGSTIVHGFFALSLCAHFIDTALQIQQTSMGINYGLERVRFLAPVPEGSRLRGVVDLASAEPIDGGVRYTLSITVELEGHDKPACVANVVVLSYEL